MMHRALPFFALIMAASPLQAEDYVVWGIECGGTVIMGGKDEGWIEGHIDARKNLYDVRVSGFLQRGLVGVRILGDLKEGETRKFRMTNNDMTLLPGLATCEVEVEYSLTPPEDDEKDEDDDKEDEEEETPSAVSKESWGALKRGHS